MQPHPRAPSPAPVISPKFQIPPLSPRPSSDSALPLSPRPLVEALSHTLSRGVEVRRAPLRPLAPARRWGGLGVGVEVEVEVGALEGSEG